MSICTDRCFIKSSIKSTRNLLQKYTHDITRMRTHHFQLQDITITIFRFDKLELWLV